MELEIGSNTTNPTTTITKGLPKKEKILGLYASSRYGGNLKAMLATTRPDVFERQPQTKGILGKFFDFAKGFIKRIK